MTTTQKPRTCQQRIHSGARWDIGGHLCSNKPTVEVDSVWYCGLRNPAKVEARKAAKREAQQAASAKRKETETAWEARAAKLTGLTGVTFTIAYSPHTNVFPRPIVGVQTRNADGLIKWLETKR